MSALFSCLHPLFDDGGRALRLVMGASMLAAGVLTVIITSRLRDAVGNGRWPEESIKPWRDRTQGGWWMAAMIGTLAVMVVSIAFDHGHRQGLPGSLYWPCLLAEQTLSQIAMAFKQPKKVTAEQSPRKRLAQFRQTAV